MTPNQRAAAASCSGVSLSRESLRWFAQSSLARPCPYLAIPQPPAMHTKANSISSALTGLADRKESNSPGSVQLAHPAIKVMLWMRHCLLHDGCASNCGRCAESLG